MSGGRYERKTIIAAAETSPITVCLPKQLAIAPPPGPMQPHCHVPPEIVTAVGVSPAAQRSAGKLGAVRRVMPDAGPQLPAGLALVTEQ